MAEARDDEIDEAGSEDAGDSPSPPWSALGPLGELLAAVIVVGALILAFLGAAAAVSWIFG
jgi:hypothetical protein